MTFLWPLVLAMTAALISAAHPMVAPSKLKYKLAVDFLRDEDGPDCVAVLTESRDRGGPAQDRRGEREDVLKLTSDLGLAGISMVGADLRAMNTEFFKQTHKSCPLHIIQLGRNASALSHSLNTLVSFAHPSTRFALFAGQVGSSAREDLLSHQVFERLPNLLLITSEAGGRQVLHSTVFGAGTEMVPVNSWNGTAFTMATLSLFAPKMRDLQGRVLRASAVVYPPFFKQTVSENGEIVEQGGVELVMVKEIAHSLNATVDVDVPTDGSYWGLDRDGDGIYDGLTGDLQQRRVDVGFSTLFIKGFRLKLMDFTHPYDFENMCFMAWKPQPAPQIVALLMPFSARTWCAVLISSALLAIWMLFYIRINKSVKVTYGNGLLMIFGTCIEQGYGITEKIADNAIRVFISLFLLCFFVISRGYSGGLISFLTVPLHRPPPDTIKDIVEIGKPTTTRCGSPVILKTSTNTWIANHLRYTHIAHDDFDGAFRNVSEGKVIMFQSKKFMEYNMRSRMTNEYGETEAHIAQECPVTFLVALGLVKNSIYTEVFDLRISSFKEGGFIGKWIRDGQHEIGGKLVSDSGGVWGSSFELRTLGLEAMQGPFAVVLSLLLPCTLAFAMEVLLVQGSRSKRTFDQNKRRNLAQP